MSEILDILTAGVDVGVGVGVGVGAGAGVPVEAVRRPQAGAVAAKLVYILPHRSLYNPLN